MKTSIPVETLLRLRLKMRKLAEVKRHPHPDDIASEYVMRLLQGLHAKASVDQAYIDIIRNTSGRKGGAGYQSRISLSKVASVEKQDYFTLSEPNPLEDLSIDDWIDLKRYLAKVECPRVAKVLTLRLEGNTLQEIAEVMDLTESRIQQIISREIERLRGVL